MNPFVYPALIVLCLCGTSTVLLNKKGEETRGLEGLGKFLTASVWTIATCMLASIGLAATTKTGGRGAIVTTVLLIACVCVIFLAKSSEKRSQERRLKRAEERV